ncbi:DUF3592 domain-containing protein [Pseudomarimonas salicorniae]|uniref:DUF3592 domain-containing protein n=1 Tax=Pseudomarimonas salicorniae TaxID=2933270 RepID=A0ABT0GLC5_9GAMM|nr:DUF3592 domain-containing protein [Lysobacter sp. CAU 1642]MCK7595338.1 DUF3592 domain-containing protein [Lysobacter sp. CAU 1642]
MGRGWSLLFGIGFLVGAAWASQRSLEYRRHGVVVEGEVVKVDARVTRDGSSLSYSERAVVRYTPSNGGPARTLEFHWATPLLGGHEPGERVRVRYLPDEADAAREDSLLFDWLLPVVLACLGLAGLTGRLRWSRHEEHVLWRSSDN